MLPDRRGFGRVVYRFSRQRWSSENDLLDFDATDDPTHGDQEHSYYHGYFEEHIYHPLLVFDGDTGQLITALLRAGNTHASRSTVAILKRIVDLLRSTWPGVEVQLRADAGFAVPAIYEYCEAEGIDYTNSVDHQRSS